VGIDPSPEPPLIPEHVLWVDPPGEKTEYPTKESLMPEKPTTGAGSPLPSLIAIPVLWVNPPGELTRKTKENKPAGKPGEELKPDPEPLQTEFIILPPPEISDKLKPTTPDI